MPTSWFNFHHTLTPQYHSGGFSPIKLFVPVLWLYFFDVGSGYDTLSMAGRITQFSIHSMAIRNLLGAGKQTREIANAFAVDIDPITLWQHTRFHWEQILHCVTEAPSLLSPGNGFVNPIYGRTKVLLHHHCDCQRRLYVQVDPVIELYRSDATRCNHDTTCRPLALIFSVCSGGIACNLPGLSSYLHHGRISNCFNTECYSIRRLFCVCEHKQQLYFFRHYSHG